MKKNVKKVELLDLMERVDITEQLAGKSIDVTLSDDTSITIEFFERDNDGAIEVRSNIYRMGIMPVASNVVKIKTEK